MPPAAPRSMGICRRLYCELLRFEFATVPRALRVDCEGLGRLYYIQNQLRSLAKRNGRKLGSRRNIEGTILWVWLERAVPVVTCVEVRANTSGKVEESNNG
jgi:hypothetical protein